MFERRRPAGKDSTLKAQEPPHSCAETHETIRTMINTRSEEVIGSRSTDGDSHLLCDCNNRRISCCTSDPQNEKPVCPTDCINNLRGCSLVFPGDLSTASTRTGLPVNLVVRFLEGSLAQQWLLSALFSRISHALPTAKPQR